MVAFERLRELLRDSRDLAQIGPLARRYFAMNAFDGVVTVIGIVMGNMIAGVQDPKVVLTTGLATAAAMGVSGFWGAYLTEAAERRRSLESLSKKMLTDLHQTRVGRASRAAVVILTVVDGLSPFAGAMFVLLPFLAAASLLDVRSAYLAALGGSVLTLFALGLFLGHISGRHKLGYALKTAVAGGVAIGLAYLLELLL